uniref:Uncharacterized protein n=1 Tax=Trichuris muris TaxID=70415 RepID=A0A5S6Q704_TRIMR
MQAIHQTESDTDLDKVAELADKILEVASAPGTTVPVNAGDSAMSQLVQRVDELSVQVASLRRWRSSSRPRFRSISRRGHRRSQCPASPMQQDDNDSRICWFHKRFGKRAKKCEPPCDFPNSNGSQ